MEHLTIGILRRELVGRPARDLLVGLGQTAGSTPFEALQVLGRLTDAPIGLWTRSGELRVADLSALVLEFNGQRDALCTIRGLRDPTSGQRRLARVPGPALRPRHRRGRVYRP
jgi:hypothetical protein